MLYLVVYRHLCRNWSVSVPVACKTIHTPQPSLEAQNARCPWGDLSPSLLPTYAPCALLLCSKLPLSEIVSLNYFGILDYTMQKHTTDSQQFEYHFSHKMTYLLYFSLRLQLINFLQLTAVWTDTKRFGCISAIPHLFVTIWKWDFLCRCYKSQEAHKIFGHHTSFCCTWMHQVWKLANINM